MYCVKVKPGTERIRVRSFSAGFLPSYTPADGKGIFTDQAMVNPSGKTPRALVVPGYVFTLQRYPTAIPVNTDEWRIIEALSDKHTSTYDPSTGIFTDGPLIGMEKHIVHAGIDHVQFRIRLLDEDRDYWVAVTTVFSGSVPDLGTISDKKRSNTSRNKKLINARENNKMENYSWEKIEAILAIAEKDGFHAASKASHVPWQTIRKWSILTGRNITPKSSKKATGKNDKAVAKNETSKAPDGSAEKNQAAIQGAADKSQSVTIDRLAAENAVLRDRVAKLEKKIERMSRIIKELQ